MKVEKSIGSHKKNLIDPDSNMYLTVNSLMEINNMITGSNNINLKKANVNSRISMVKLIFILVVLTAILKKN